MKTAIRLFVKQGFENTPTSQITEEAGIASGTLFYHFNTKEKLISETYDYIVKNIHESISKDLSVKKGIEATLFKVWCNLLHWGLNHEEEHIFLEKFFNSGFASDHTIAKFHKAFSELMDLMKQGTENKILKEWEPEVLFEVCRHIYFVFREHFSTCKKIDNKDLSASFEVFWDAVKR